MIYRNLLLLAGAVVLAAVPLLIYLPNGGEEGLFSGADGQAEEVILESHPDYKPWFSNLWEPPSTEIECMLFSLQAAIGAGLVCYCIGYYRGRHVARQRKQETPTDATR